jgi:hypothetical protein
VVTSFALVAAFSISLFLAALSVLELLNAKIAGTAAGGRTTRIGTRESELVLQMLQSFSFFFFCYL